MMEKVGFIDDHTLLGRITDLPTVIATGVRHTVRITYGESTTVGNRIEIISPTGLGAIAMSIYNKGRTIAGRKRYVHAVGTHSIAIGYCIFFRQGTVIGGIYSNRRGKSNRKSKNTEFHNVQV